MGGREGEGERERGKRERRRRERGERGRGRNTVCVTNKSGTCIVQSSHVEQFVRPSICIFP